MINRLSAIILLVAASIAAVPCSAAYIETPGLAARVASGDLPGVGDRLPLAPRVIDLAAMGREAGRHGGDVNMLIGSQRDLRYMTVYSYARLVGYDRDYQLIPDILERFEVEEGRIFTFHLRPGHKWSDGHPFTAEDFRYYWEDVANNEELSPGGPPVTMLADGKPPVFEVLSDTAVRYSWDAPNPDFLPALAGPQPLYIYMPAHYMRQFHASYQDKDRLEKLVKAEKVKDWGSLHTRMGRMYRAENPDLPALDPWINTTKPPAERFVFSRNPFFHRIDREGRQLPYLDNIVLSVSSSSIIPAKTGTGESDLQARYLRFDDYTFLKSAEKEQDFNVRLWRTGTGSQVALIPNLNYKDPVWRGILRDVRFRRALSLGIDRHEINQAIYYGLANESGNTVLPDSPLYRRDYATAWTQYDPDLANKLLDEAGLDRRDSDGVRLLPDGRRAEIIVASAGEAREEADVLELIHDTWLEIGIKIYPRTSQREVFRSRIFAGETLLAIAFGLDNALARPAMSPWELAPTQQHQLQWSQWGHYAETKGAKGEAPDLPEAKDLLTLYKRWRQSVSDGERAAIWHEMLKINAEQVFTIGIVNGCLQPVVVARNLHNVPEQAVYSFEPGAYFGVYMPDTFFLSEGK